jgi:hypothetical protein
MSEPQVSAQVSVSAYRSPIEAAEVALSLESELETYERERDRGPLVRALKEQFLLTRYLAALQAENNRKLGLQILFKRVERMSDKMLLKTVRVLSDIGALDLTAVTGTSVPVSETPMVSIQQAFKVPAGGSQPSLGERSSSNPVKEDGMVPEADEHIAAHLREKAPHQIEQEVEQDERTDPFRPDVLIDPDQWFRLTPIAESR